MRWGWEGNKVRWGGSGGGRGIRVRWGWEGNKGEVGVGGE